VDIVRLLFVLLFGMWHSIMNVMYRYLFVYSF